MFSNTGPNGEERALDRTWDEVQDYSQKVLKVDQRREKTFFNTMDERALEGILKQWLALGDAMKERIEAGKHKNEVKGAVIILDDYIDNHRFARTSPIIEALAARSRHCFLSCWFSVQSYRAVIAPFASHIASNFAIQLASRLYKKKSGTLLARRAFRRSTMKERKSHTASSQFALISQMTCSLNASATDCPTNLSIPIDRKGFGI